MKLSRRVLSGKSWILKRRRYKANKLMAMAFADHILMMAISSLSVTFISELTKYQQHLR